MFKVWEMSSARAKKPNNDVEMQDFFQNKKFSKWHSKRKNSVYETNKENKESLSKGS